MKKIAIIIPSRLAAQRLPNKPLKLINNKEMILHVYDAAIKSNVGEVYVATPDQKIFDIVKKFGGNVIKTSENHKTGTDRIFEVFKETLNSEPNIVINLQGDMPNIDPKAISNLASYMNEKKCEIGTLASDFNSKDEIDNPNLVKVAVKEKFSENTFLNAIDFFRVNNNSEIRQCLKFGNQKINIHDYKNLIKPGAKIPRPGTGDICFISDIDVLEWQKIFISNSINIEFGPTKQIGAKGELFSIYVRDPDENLIEIANRIK